MEKTKSNMRKTDKERERLILEAKKMRLSKDLIKSFLCTRHT
ncbi:hypothetical protein [Lederbergia sp. NSJ-179]|nr:hypothetical protein [Lederbergia sp. NSJ-179]